MQQPGGHDEELRRLGTRPASLAELAEEVQPREDLDQGEDAGQEGGDLTSGEYPPSSAPAREVLGQRAGTGGRRGGRPPLGPPMRRQRGRRGRARKSSGGWSRHSSSHTSGTRWA